RRGPGRKPCGHRARPQSLPPARLGASVAPVGGIDRGTGGGVKKILTVRGPIEPSELGQTLFHEHIFADLREHWIEPETAQGCALADAPVTPELLATLRRYPFSTTLDNLLLADEQVAIPALAYFHPPAPPPAP